MEEELSMNKTTYTILKNMGLYLLVILLVVWCIVAVSFQVNNPKANQLQVFFYLKDAVYFRKVAEFQ